MSWDLKEEQGFAARNGKGGPSWENRGKSLEEGGRSGLWGHLSNEPDKVSAFGGPAISTHPDADEIS